MKFLYLLFCLLSLPLVSLGVDLSQLNDGLTRAKADDLFSKDYEFTVLSDVSVRREWNKKDSYVALDFNISTEKLIMAQIRYKTPINSKLAIADAVKMAGTKLPKWSKAKTAQAKSIGLRDCFYTKTDNGNYFFIEVNGNNNALSTVFFAVAPKENRRELSEASTQTYTAMGSSGTAAAAAVVYEDELARLTADKKSPQAVATTKKVSPQSPVASTSGTKTEKTLPPAEEKVEHGLERGEIVAIAALSLLALIVIVFASRRKKHLPSPPNGPRTLKK